MIKLRIITAAVLIPFTVLAVYLLPQFLFVIFMTVVTLLCAWEWGALAGIKHKYLRVFYMVAVLMSLCIAFFVSLFLAPLLFFLISLIVWIILFLGMFFLAKKKISIKLPTFIAGLLGCIILTFSWEAILLLHLTPSYLMFLLIIVWLTDTSAYAIGKRWGKHLFAPSISPKKTWEGVIGSSAITFIVASLSQKIFNIPNLFFYKMLGIIFITIVFSILGDLFESRLKRLQGIKDSSSLLPGHGGVLDRLDSLLAAAPIFAYSLLLIGLIKL